MKENGEDKNVLNFFPSAPPSLFLLLSFARIHSTQFVAVPSLAVHLPICSPCPALLVLCRTCPFVIQNLNNWVGEAKMLMRLWSGFWGITAAGLFAFFSSLHQRKLRGFICTCVRHRFYKSDSTVPACIQFSDTTSDFWVDNRRFFLFSVERSSAPSKEPSFCPQLIAKRF